MDAVFTMFLGLLVVGAVTARITGWMMRSWLATHAGWIDTAGQRVLRYFFGVFVDIGTATQFIANKKVRSEPPTLAYVFFSSFGVTMLGLLGLLVAVAAH